LVAEKNFLSECHQVATADDYLLNVFRIKHPNTPEGAPVVFMQHGLMGSADNFIMNDEMSPAFILARAGYDVWLGNSRGSPASRNHKFIDPDKDGEFWNFSWE
jgi:pimeloyl-ACP methyl ester carboxylesterase